MSADMFGGYLKRPRFNERGYVVPRLPFPQNQRELRGGGFGPVFLVGEDGVLQRFVSLGVGELGDARDGLDEDGLRRGGVLVQPLDDHVDRDVVVVGMPAIVIGDHGNGGVGDLRFAGQLGFNEVGHADDGIPGGAVGLRFGAGRELRPLDVDVSAALVDGGPGGLGGDVEDFLQFGADWLAKGNMGDDAFPEEGVGGAALGAVEELVGQDDFARRVIVLERADRADADDPLDAKLLEAVDVGAVGDFVGEELVTAGVAGEEDDLMPGELALDIGVGG